MRKFLVLFIGTVFFLGTGGISNAVEIESITFSECISELCTSPISVTANDPEGGNLEYNWTVLNGDASMIIGSGADVEFDPPDVGPHPCPYHIEVAVTSDASDLSEYRTIDVCVKMAGDIDGNGVVNIIDKVAVRNAFGQSGDPGWIDADVDCNGVVNILDKVVVRNQFGQKAECQDSYFFDNFECGTGKWTLSGNDWGLTESAFHGGNSSLTDSPGGDYPINADEIAIMRSPIDLSLATKPVLTFWHKYSLALYDYLYVEVSSDGGFSWQTVQTLYHSQYQSTWTQEMIDLSPYISSSVKIRFRLREFPGYVADGWYIDDVEIREWDAVPTLPYPFSDDFETGLDNWSVSGVDWTRINTAVLGGNYVLTDSPEGDYPSNANTTLTTQGFFDLSSATFPVLTFWHKYSLALYDYLYVEVSSDGGFSWQTVQTLYHSQYQSTWTQEMIDLSPYISSSVKIRFRLRELSGYEADGWSIDNVEIREWDAVCYLPYPFSDDFEAGLDNWSVSGVDWRLIDTTSVSGTFSITDSPDENYPSNANTTLMTDCCLDLSSATFPVLTFWHKYSLALYDYLHVEVSSDGGLTWQALYTLYHNQYQSTWTQEMFDLSPYISECVKIRFRLRELSGYVADGWYIDDVNIAEFE